MILIGLGSNLPHLHLKPAQIIRAACDSVAALEEVSAVSPFYESDAWPDSSGPRYINAVLRLDQAALSPARLLHALHVVEASFGRNREYLEGGERYASRTLDIDLLAYDELVIESENHDQLKLPHPAIQDRDFVLLPLRDVAPDWRHPVTAATAEEMLAKLKESGSSFTAKRLDPMDIK